MSESSRSGSEMLPVDAKSFLHQNLDRMDEEDFAALMATARADGGGSREGRAQPQWTPPVSQRYVLWRCPICAWHFSPMGGGPACVVLDASLEPFVAPTPLLRVAYLWDGESSRWEGLSLQLPSTHTNISDEVILSDGED